jgi:hypothetical protein
LAGVHRAPPSRHAPAHGETQDAIGRNVTEPGSAGKPLYVRG